MCTYDDDNWISANVKLLFGLQLNYNFPNAIKLVIVKQFINSCGVSSLPEGALWQARYIQNPLSSCS